MNVKPSFARRGLQAGVILFAIGMASAHVIYWQRKANPAVIRSTKSAQVLEDLRIIDDSQTETQRASDDSSAANDPSISKRGLLVLSGTKSYNGASHAYGEAVTKNPAPPPIVPERSSASAQSPTATPLVKSGSGLFMISSSKSLIGASHVYRQAFAITPAEPPTVPEKQLRLDLPNRLGPTATRREVVMSESKASMSVRDELPLAFDLQGEPGLHFSTGDHEKNQALNVRLPIKSETELNIQYDTTLANSTTVKGIVLISSSKAKLTGSSTIFGEVIPKGVSLNGRSKVINPYVDSGSGNDKRPTPAKSENPEKNTNAPAVLPTPTATPVAHPTPAPAKP
jgi:hypothetical protein